MVMAMIRRPPHWSELRRGCADPCEHKLKGTTGFKRTMRKVAMKTCSQRKDPNRIGQQQSAHRYPTKAGKEGTNTGQMHDNNR